MGYFGYIIDIPSGNSTQLLNMAMEIVDFAMKNADVPQLCQFTRGYISIYTYIYYLLSYICICIDLSYLIIMYKTVYMYVCVDTKYDVDICILNS